MTRRWFGKVIGAIAAACGMGSALPPKKSTGYAIPASSHIGIAREAIAAGNVGWVDLLRYKDGAYCSAVKAKALWDVRAGDRVVVADALEARRIGDFPLIWAGEFHGEIDHGQIHLAKNC